MRETTPHILSGIRVMGLRSPVPSPCEQDEPEIEVDVDLDFDEQGVQPLPLLSRLDTPALPLVRKRRHHVQRLAPPEWGRSSGAEMEEAFAQANAESTSKRARPRLAKSLFFVVFSLVLALLAYEISLVYEARSLEIRELLNRLL